MDMDNVLTVMQTESGNMLIMTLSYTQKTNDLSLIQNFVSISPPLSKRAHTLIATRIIVWIA